MGSPAGRRSYSYQLLAGFPLEVVYIKGEDSGAADVLSGWVYPANLANPDINLHGSDAEQVGRDEWELQTRSCQMQNSQGLPLRQTLSPTIPPYHLTNGTPWIENG